MAREIITKIWCDVCMEDEVFTEATETPPIIIGNWKPRVLALCERHQKEVYEPLRSLLGELGQILPEQASPSSMSRMPGTAPGSGVFPCPDPNCAKHTKPYKHEQSLRNHGKEVHGTRGLKELYAMFADGGQPAPAESLFDADEEAPSITRAECDHCDTVYQYPEYKRPAQALGVHKAKAHNIRGAKHDRKTVSA